MVNVTADETVRALLTKVTEVAAIRDGDGNMIGLFTPWAKAEGVLYRHAAELFDLAEIKRREESESTGNSIEEVRRRLQSLEPHG